MEHRRVTEGSVVRAIGRVVLGAVGDSDCGGEGPAGLVGLILCVTFAKNPYPSLGWARSLAAYLPVKHFPRWLRAPLMWGSTSPSDAPSQMERAISGVSAAVHTVSHCRSTLGGR